MTNQQEEGRFEILEALVAETVSSGRSERLERWMSISREALGPLQESRGAREKRSAAKIVEAFELAAELVETLVSEAKA